MDDVLLVAGGIIPEDDRQALEEMGIRGVFGPGTTTGEIIAFIRTELGEEAALEE